MQSSPVKESCVAARTTYGIPEETPKPMELPGQVARCLPDTPNMHNTLTMLGYRFGHQSGLDESPGRNSSFFLHGIEFHVYFVLLAIDRNFTYLQTFTKHVIKQKGILFFRKQSACGKPETP